MPWKPTLDMDLALIALAWLAYGALHSALASVAFKAWLAQQSRGLARNERLLFNFVAIVLLIPPLWLTWRYSGAVLWHWPLWLSWSAALLSVAGFVWSLRWYDGMAFLGLCADGPPRLVISPMHRFVRHPWYSLGLLLLWTRDLNAAWLVTALAVTLYVWIGCRIEEHKLIATLGDDYRRYRDQVPALLPRLGRRLPPVGGD